MQANWSLILNILLLIVVIVAIVRLIKAKRQNTTISRSRERSMSSDSGKAYGNPTAYGDDIIAVRKINDKEIEKKARDTTPQSTSESPMPRLIAEGEESFEACKNTSSHVSSRNTPNFTTTEKTLMMFLLARENRQFAGYELLQTVLAAGLRFGDDGLFHRHQFPNGDGDIICSLASATAAGTFDLQNIGAFSVRGLCLYMHLTTNTQVNKDHFTLMLNTANLLAEGLDAHLLDENRQPITEERLEQYQEYLHQEIDFA